MCEDDDGDQDGEWVPQIPSCIGKKLTMKPKNSKSIILILCIGVKCPQLPKILHYSTYAECSNQYFINSVCTINCKEGATMTAGATTQIKCVDPDADGTANWDATPPSCEG